MVPRSWSTGASRRTISSITSTSIYVLARLTQPGDVPTLGPSSITIGPDHAMWLTEDLANKIGRLTLSGHVKEFAAATCACTGDHSSGVQDIVAGPDGGLWFIEVNANRIGRIGLDGRIRDFPIPSSGSNNTRDPVSLLVGPDGNLWFAEFFDGKIARVTMDGRLTEFSLGQRRCSQRYTDDRHGQQPCARQE